MARFYPRDTQIRNRRAYFSGNFSSFRTPLGTQEKWCPKRMAIYLNPQKIAEHKSLIMHELRHIGNQHVSGSSPDGASVPKRSFLK